MMSKESRVPFRSLMIFVSFVLLISNHSLSAQGNIELKLQKGHSGKINEILFSPSGKRLISCSDDHTIKLWDVKSGKELKSLEGHRGSVKSIAINKNGTTIFSGGDKKEKKVIFWDAVTGEKKGELSSFEGAVSQIKFSPYGNRIAVLESLSAFEARVSIWDEALSTKRFDLKLPADFFPVTIDFHPGNNHLVVGGKFLKKKKTINVFVFDSSTGSEIQQFKGTSTSVSKLYYSRKGNKLAVIGTNIQVWSSLGSEYSLEQTIPINGTHAMFFDNETKLIISKGNDLFKWDLKANKVLEKVINGHESAIRAVSLTLDEKYFVTAANDNQINFWDKSSFTKIPHFSGVKPDQIKEIAFSKDYRSLYSVVDNSRIQYWNLAKAKLDFITPKLERKGYPIDISFGSDKQFMAICGSQTKGVEIWNIKTYKPEMSLRHTSFVSKAIMIPNSSKVVGAGKDRKILIWDRVLPDVKPVALMGHRANIYCLESDQEGKTLYSGGKDKTLKVWDLTLKTLKFSINVGNEINTIAVSPDGSKVVIGCGSMTNKYGNTAATAMYVLETNRLSDYSRMKSLEDVPQLTGHSSAVSYVKFSDDGTRILSGGADSKIFVWDANSYAQLKSISGHSSTINTLSMDKSNKYLISGSSDATTRFWNNKTGISDLNLVTFNDGNEYIIYDNNNYYSCTKNGAKNVHFVIDNQVFLFEQFDLKLNRPDLVFANMPGINNGLLRAYKKAYLKRLKKMNFTESMLSDDFNIPEISLVNDEEIPYKVSERNITLKIHADDKMSQLDRLNVWINDVPLYGKSGINLRTKGINTLDMDLDIELSTGKNKIQISVLNQSGAESFKVSKFVYFEQGNMKNDLYVIGIGVSKFKDSEFNLDYAAKDATDVVNQFSEDKTAYNNIYTKLLLNENATRENITGMKSFLKGSKIDDNVIVFIASHGLLDDEMDYYLATTDIDFYHPSTRGLVYEDLEGLLDGIPARKKLLLIDACHSGEVDKDETYHAPIPPTTPVEETPAITAEVTAVKESAVKSRGFKRTGGATLGMASSFELMKQLFADLRRGSGATVISSAGGKEFALESGEWNNGVFTYCFLNGLKSREADANGDNDVDVAEIRNYVSDNVKAMTNGQQNPTYRKENLDNNYKIW
ncbi:MAG: caspase family protein [Reichenbachiella sp.]